MGDVARGGIRRVSAHRAVQHVGKGDAHCVQRRPERPHLEVHEGHEVGARGGAAPLRQEELRRGARDELRAQDGRRRAGAHHRARPLRRGRNPAQALVPRRRPLQHRRQARPRRHEGRPAEGHPVASGLLRLELHHERADIRRPPRPDGGAPQEGPRRAGRPVRRRRAAALPLPLRGEARAS